MMNLWDSLTEEGRTAVLIILLIIAILLYEDWKTAGLLMLFMVALLL